MKNPLLRPKKDSQFWKDVVAVDVFVHEQQILADVRSALSAGLRPVSFSLIEQADGDAVVLRLERGK
jgi:hypothetical protein